jgi:hypothetical protein
MWINNGTARLRDYEGEKTGDTYSFRRLYFDAILPEIIKKLDTQHPLKMNGIIFD